MKLANTGKAYGLVTRVLHWSVAVLILALIAIGFWMVDLDYYNPWYNEALELHKSLGMLALFLGVVKVLWVSTNARVDYHIDLSQFERVASVTVHRFFLAAMVLVPLSGYLISTSQGDGISVFDIVEVPAVAAISDRVRDLAIAIHYYLAYAVAALAVLHAGAAIKHQFVDGNGSLRRMLW